MKAFPSNGFFEKTSGGEQPQKLNPVMGMDLRDYFAAKAMQGMATWDIKVMDKLATDFGELPDFYLAKNAYAIADAMMETRKK